MSRYVLQLCCLFALVSFSLAQKKTTASSQADKTPAANPATAESGGRLPVKRVVLYKNGVGYFEHSARVHGSQDLTIDFTTAQLNDVLKSLTVVDLGEGRISGVRYNSIAPLDERLKALRLPFGESITQADFLAALRGARVEVRSGSVTASGRLLSVETEQRTTDKGVSYNVTKFSVITDAGEMRNFELGPGTSVRLAERDLTDEVGKYLGLIGSSRARDLRRMTISATGAGDRNIFVSYISEVPVWKSTYRIILPAKAGEKPLLQGWAIVDNTVGEDWKDVQLSLVAGAPQSFIENISQPYYTRRPVVELPPSVMLTPQEHEGTMKSEVVEGQAGSGLGYGVAGKAKDAIPENAIVLDGPPPPPPANLPMNGRSFTRMARLQQGIAKQPVEAESKDLGDYFEYNVKQPITIGKNQSALVPILQARIDAVVSSLECRGQQPDHLRQVVPV